LSELSQQVLTCWTCITQVDAHADINNPTRSVSGNMHGMPVSFLMGLVENANKLPGFEWIEPTVSPKDLVYIGLRDLDQDEKDTIKRLGIKAFSVSLLHCGSALRFPNFHCIICR
jgi:arginase